VGEHTLSELSENLYILKNATLAELMPDAYEAFLRRQTHLLLIKTKGGEYDPVYV
jgi:hypothetical protein